MPVFAYRVLDRRHTALTGTISADSPRQARDKLRARGLLVEEVRPQQSPRRSAVGWLLRRRGPASGYHAARMATMLRELATLLSVGVDLPQALHTLARQHRGHFQASILLLSDRIAGGAGLAEAMGEQAGVFDELTVRMVEVGENTGNLEQVLDQLADFQERSLQLKDRVIGALLYPAVVFATALGVTVFLMTVVVPMLLTNLVEAGRTLPWPTRVLKGLSDFLLAHGLLLLAGGVGLAIAVLLLLRTAGGRRVWHRLLLRLPLIGSLARRQAIARLAATIATLMRSGIVYLRAAEIAAGTSGNCVFREALLESSREVTAGRDIGGALEQTGVFPPVVVHVFSVGQASGRLEDMLDRLAATYDRQVNSLCNRLASVLEPILILVLAVFVGFILFATLLDKENLFPIVETVRLGQWEFQVVLDDESRKLNLNRLYLGGGSDKVCEALDWLGQSRVAVRLRPHPDHVRNVTVPPFESWGQVYRLDELPTREHPAQWLAPAVGDVTCWGEGRVHYSRCSNRVLEFVAREAAGPVTANRLLRLRSEDPSLGLDELLDCLALRQQQKYRLKGWLTEKSSCYCLWLTAEEPGYPLAGRAWHELRVAELTPSESLDIHQFTW